jgi:hypothetical protein
MQKYISAPFAKIIKKEDGGREVWGFATLERKDKSGEIADFDGTVKAFEKWSSETEKRTNGKSSGNVRVMHQPVVAGKSIHWEPAETEIEDENGELQKVKAIWVGAYVPSTKTDIIKDIDEGILSAFSIGGDYEKRWWDGDSGAFRYIPRLSEYSLVDNPCVPGADFVNVISKAASTPWNKNSGGVGMELEKGFEGSFEDRGNDIREALNRKYGTIDRPYFDGYVVATYSDKIYVQRWDTSKYYEISYTYDQAAAESEEVTLGEQVEVEHVESFVPVESLKMAKTAKEESDKLKNEEKEGKEKMDEEKDVKKDEMEMADGAKEEGTKDEAEVEKKEDKKEITKDEVEEVAKSAGVTMEQLTAVLKAFTEMTAKPITVDTVDGDGDKDNNQEFPNTPPKSDSEYIDINEGVNSVKEAEKKPAEKSADGELNKSGKSVSKANMTHLTHAIKHVEAVMKGIDYGPEHHLEIEGLDENSGPNSGMESPNVEEKCYSKSFSGILEKAVENELNKAVNKLESLVKGLATAESLTKTFDRLESLEKMVKEIHETPQNSGVMLNGGSPDVLKMFKGMPSEGNDNSDSVQKFIANIKDPMLKSRVGEEVAIQMAKQILK